MQTVSWSKVRFKGFSHSIMRNAQLPGHLAGGQLVIMKELANFIVKFDSHHLCTSAFFKKRQRQNISLSLAEERFIQRECIIKC